MSFPVAFLPEARDDIYDVFRFYQREKRGLGEECVAAISDVVDRIQANPKLYPLAYKDVRTATVRRFPYVVHYCERDGRVLIVAVQHGRRNKGQWKERV